MDRSLRAVLVGTFTLRFSTGPDRRDARPATSPTCPSTAGRAVGRDGRRRCSRATFYVAELVLSPIFGILSDRLGHHRVMLVRAGLRWRRGRSSPALTIEPAGARRHAPARGRLDRRERPVDPRLHRPRDGRQRGPARQGGGPLRGRDAGRARGRLHRRAQAVRGARPGRLLPQRRRLRRLVPRSTGSASSDPSRRARRRVAADARRVRRGTCVLRPAVARLAAGPDLDRGQRRDRPVVQPVALPVREGRPASSRTRS